MSKEIQPDAVKRLKMTSETGKISKSQRYALTPSKLEEALLVAGVSIDVHLARQPGDSFFYAEFWPPNQNVPHDRLYIQAGTVPADLEVATRRKIEDQMIARVAKWAAGILAQHPRSPLRREKQLLDFRPIKRAIVDKPSN